MAAKKFYFPLTTAAPYEPPAPGTGWEEYETGFVTRALVRTAGSSTLTTTNLTPTACGGGDHIADNDAHHRSYVYGPLAAQTILQTTTVRGQFQILENNAGNNLFIAMKLYTMSSAGALKSLLLATTRKGTEPTTSLRNTTFAATALAGSGADVTVALGDYLVVEVGLGGLPVAASGTQNHRGSIRWGETASSGDLPVDETTSTTTYRPWIEFSADIAPAIIGVLAQDTETDVAQALSILTVDPHPYTSGATQIVISQRGLWNRSALLNLLNIWKQTPIFVSVAGIQVPITVATQTDVAQALSHARTFGITQVTENDLSQAISRLHALGIGRVTEADIAQALSFLGVTAILGTSYQPWTQKRHPYGILYGPGGGLIPDFGGIFTGTDFTPFVQWANPFNSASQIFVLDHPGFAFGIAAKEISVVNVTEADIVQVLIRLKTKSINQIAELDLSQSLTSKKLKQIAQDTETDLSRVLSLFKSRNLVLLTESDIGFALSHSKQINVVKTTEDDLPQVLIKAIVDKWVTLVISTELDQTFGVLVNPIHRMVNATLETDLIQAIGQLKTLVIVKHDELDESLVLTRRRWFNFLSDTETDSSLSVGRKKSRGISEVESIEEALGIVYRIPPHFIDIDDSEEVDEVEELSSAKAKDMNQVDETERARAIAVLLGSEGGGIRRRHGVFYYGHKGKMGI